MTLTKSLTDKPKTTPIIDDGSKVKKPLCMSMKLIAAVPNIKSSLPLVLHLILTKQVKKGTKRRIANSKTGIK